MAYVHCPLCGKKMRKQSRKSRPNSRGYCRKCYLKNPLSGKELPSFRGGRTKDKRGYVYITISTLPEELQELCKQSVENRSYGKRRSGRIYEHHVEMIKKINRPLKKGEVVHHVNGVKNDNRIENLLLMNQKEHLMDYRQALYKIKELEKEIQKLRQSPTSHESVS